MKKISLLRHAKSSWDDSGLDDFERPLNKRGRAAAPLIGAFMKDKGLAPDCVLCSSAVRTRQTLDLVLPHLPANPNIIHSDRLYHASPRDMLAALIALNDERGHILLIAHNPGIHMLALDLLDTQISDRDAVERLSKKYPTAALAHFELKISHWRETTVGAGVLTVFKTPKELTNA